MAVSYATVSGPAREVFTVRGPMYCPYDSTPKHPHESFGLHYYHQGPFEHNPFTIHAQAASGSPVVMGWHGGFFGFLRYAGITGSTVAFDGGCQLTFNIPEGQVLYVGQEGDPKAHWQTYNERVMQDIGYTPITSHPDFWALAEYCTWVEQKVLAGPHSPHHPLNHDMVVDFVDAIDAFGYPKGKVTIDHGWTIDPNRTGFGDWAVAPDKFPDLARTAAAIAERGHVPGLWIGLAKIHPQSELARRNPEFLGQVQTAPWQEADAGLDTNAGQRMHFLNPDAHLTPFFRDVFARFHGMGFRKFKIDMSYHRKDHMIRLHEMMYTAAKEVEPTLEIEFHLPDIFGARWTDSVRTNDVWCVPFKPWYELTAERYRTCTCSAPGRVINRDHMGGNHVDVTPEDFLAHVETYRHGVGYPLVSMLPHHIGEHAVTAIGEILWDYDGRRNALSDA